MPIEPGQITLTRIRCCASSIASICPSASCPAFVVAYALAPAVVNVRVPLIELVMAIAPPAFFISGTAWCTVRNVPRRLIRTVSSHSSGFSSSIGAQTPFTPALAKTKSSRPKRSFTRPKRSAICPSSATSAATAIAARPIASISPATFSISSAVRLTTTTSAPARASATADAAPMPDPAPVTSAILSVMSICQPTCWPSGMRCTMAGSLYGPPLRPPPTRSFPRERNPPRCHSREGGNPGVNQPVWPRLALAPRTCQPPAPATPSNPNPRHESPAHLSM